MKIAVVDDEEVWQENIIKELERFYMGKEIRIEAFASGEAFLNRREEYELVLLDVEMGGMDGFETAMQYKNDNSGSMIIILTTHTELSRRGYLVDAFRYIDKRHMSEELEEALGAVEKRLQRKQKICVHMVNHGELYLMLQDIFYIETVKRNVLIHTAKSDYLCSDNISDLEKRLQDRGFYRCHKSYLINLDEVRNFSRTDAYMTDNSRAMVSTRKYAELKKKYLARKFEYANS